jgi:hypothetical protein
MCVYSNIMGYGQRWLEPYVPVPNQPYIYSPPLPDITDEQIRKFEKLLELAKEFDDLTKQPDCESIEKKKLLKDLAEKLKIKINFPDDTLNIKEIVLDVIVRNKCGKCGFEYEYTGSNWNKTCCPRCGICQGSL